MCVDALSTASAEQAHEAILSALRNLLRSDLAIGQIALPVCIELVQVLHR